MAFALQTDVANELYKSLQPMLDQRQKLEILQGRKQTLEKAIKEKQIEIDALKSNVMPKIHMAEKSITRNRTILLKKGVMEEEILYYCIIRTLCGLCLLDLSPKTVVATDIQETVNRVAETDQVKKEMTRMASFLSTVCNLFRTYRLGRHDTVRSNVEMREEYDELCAGLTSIIMSLRNPSWYRFIDP